MKLVFISNFMNHHQLPVAQRLHATLGYDYKFIALEGLPEERRSMGYADMNQEYPFVVCAYDSPEQQAYADKLVLECDVLIAGSCPDHYIKRRTDVGKIVIKTSERYFKKAESWVDTIHHYLSAKKHLAPFQNKPLYFLCASAYTADDVNKYTNFYGKTYKWGYFPEIKKYDDVDKIIEWKHPASILWVARLIEWKHPELPVMVAKRLKAEGYQFQLNLIGNGALEEKIRKMIASENISDCVHMLGAMKPEEVRRHMEESEIFLFTSDRNEGWGAVLNEAMNSGCAVIANREIGSVPYLIKNGENGLIYDSIDELYQFTKKLIGNCALTKKLGKAAYTAIATCWNADIASKRLLQLIAEINKNDECASFDEGPCSKTGGI